MPTAPAGPAPAAGPDALFRDLLDDAALFPPGNAPMAQAVPAHAQHVAAWYAPVVGPFLCAGSRLADLSGTLDAPSADVAVLELGVVLDEGTGSLADIARRVADDARLLLRGVEIPLRGEPVADAAKRAVAAVEGVLGGPDDEAPVAIEVPWTGGWRRAIDVVAESGHRVKLRTGGDTADAFPTAEALAERLIACLDLAVPVKLTAGLHHAVRHTDPGTGFEHHGFLNVLLAVRDGLDGGTTDDLAATLAERDSEVLVTRAAALTDDAAAGVRRTFVSYGTCSILEPVDDLVRLGLLTPPPDASGGSR